MNIKKIPYKKKRLISTFTLFFIILSSTQSFSITCTSLLEVNTIDVQSFLRNAQDFSLTGEVKKILEDHDLAQTAKKTNYGEGIVFNTDFFLGNNFSSSDTLFRGEKIQLEQVFRYLKHLFPKAEFLKEIKSRKKEIIIEIEDLAESRGKKSSIVDALNKKSEVKTDVNYLEMTILKTANPGPKIKSKDILRKELGIEEKEAVLHIYLPQYAEDKFMQGGMLIKLIERLSPDFDKFIISTGSVKNPSKNKRVSTAWNKLSRIKEAKGTDSLPTNLFYNDTTGALPSIHRLSDVSLVIGPIDFLQSLNAGTPTIHWKQYGEEYYATDLGKKILEFSALHPLYHPINNIGEITDLYESLLKNVEPTLSTNDIRSKSGLTTFEIMLNSLNELILKSLQD